MKMKSAERSTSPPKAPARLCFGPQDHGVEADDRTFESAEYEPGFRYEVIDGRLYVSPQADKPHWNFLEWLELQVRAYMLTHPDRIKEVSTHSRVFVPGNKKTTSPEPDLAIYDRKKRLSAWNDSWHFASPVVVAEVCGGDIDKDFRRNVALYEQVPSIREYWLVYYGSGPKSFFFRSYVKRAGRWGKTPHNLHIGDTYTTALFPGFKLLIDPE